ncbi:MAG TPA: cytochrome c [Terriglobales bacterium]|nr:cytochrome c [Terriglobales bacterium]
MKWFYGVLLAVLTLASSAPLLSQQPKIKKVPAPHTSPASGKEMYVTYCASCHGTHAKGDGPAAGALKTPPADLTTLAQKNNGKFPSSHFAAVLSGEEELTAHGSKDMPVWGPVFLRVSQGHATEVQQRISNLSRYIESLQGK